MPALAGSYLGFDSQSGKNTSRGGSVHNRLVTEGTVARRTVVEQTIWKTQVASGALQGAATVTLELSNLRAICDTKSVMLKDCDKIVVANKRKSGGAIVGDVSYLSKTARGGHHLCQNTKPRCTCRDWQNPKGECGAGTLTGEANREHQAEGGKPAAGGLCCSHCGWEKTPVDVKVLQQL